MNKVVTKYFFISIGFSVVWILIEHVLGYNTTKHEIGQYTRNATMFLYWMMIILAILETRKRKGGTLTLRDGLMTGIPLSLLYSFCFAAAIFLYVKLINPDFYSSIMEFKMNQLHKQHASPEETDKVMKEVEASYSDKPMTYVLLFAFSSVFGIAVSVIGSLIFRRKNLSVL